MGQTRADTAPIDERAAGQPKPENTPSESLATGDAAVTPPGNGQPPGPDPKVADVWSRTQPKYRIRAAVLLIINLLLFCSLCAFARWLHGQPFEFSLHSYTEPARFWDGSAPNLTDFILTPINVVDVPLHGVVLGLVIATMVAVPIAVAILYRFASALPFAAAVLIFAHMPGLALTLVASCLLAAVRPFRLNFRFGAALLGLLPVLLYLYLATRGTPEQLANYGSPAQKSLLVFPWIIAILGASAMLAAVLLIARLVNFRPGAVAPVLAVTFAAPAALFHFGVGTDERAYRVLEAEYGPRSRRFEPVRKSDETKDAILELVSNEIRGPSFTDQLRSGLMAVWSLQPEKVRELKRRVSRRFLAEFLSDRHEANEACRTFIADHPQSCYVPCVLFIEARILDTRLDEARLAQDEPYRELYADFPNVQSEEVWLNLLKHYPDSPFAIAAATRLAETRLRAGHVDEALEALRAGLDRNGGLPASTQPRHRSLLSAAAPEHSLEFEPEPYRREARQLAEVIAANRDDPRYGPAPLLELAGLDPRRARYLEQLQRLAQKYQDSLLHDNLVVRWASALPDAHERAATLAGCVRTFPSGDALPEALYRLANLEIQALAAEDPALRAQGVARLREVADRFPDTCWGRLAAERLELLEPRTATTGAKP